MARSKAEKVSTDRTPARALLLPYERNLTEYEALVASARPVRVFAVDPGVANIASCFIQFDGDAITETVSNKFEMPKFQTVFARLYYIERALSNWIAAYKPDVIVKEGIAHYMKFGVADAGRIQHLIERLAFEHGVPYVTVSPSVMRAFVGSKEKSDTKLKVWQRWGVQFDSEDETDAFAIGMTGRALLTGEWAIKPKSKPKKKAA